MKARNTLVYRLAIFRMSRISRGTKVRAWWMGGGMLGFEGRF